MKKELEELFEKYHVKIDLVKEYITFKKGLGQTAATIKNNAFVLTYIFNKMNISTEEDVINLKNKDLITFLHDIIDKDKISMATRNNYVVLLQEFYRYLLRMGYSIDENIITLPRAKVPKKEIRYLNAEEVTMLFQNTNDLRAKSIIGLLVYNGLRVNEVINIKMSDIKIKEDELKFKYYHIKIHGKGRKDRHASAKIELSKVIEKYIEGKRKSILERTQKENEYLFVSDNGYKMDASNICKMVKTKSKRAGIKDADKMSPHKLRHSYATLMLNSPKHHDVTTVSRSMGHENIATTNIYAHTTEKNITDMQMEGW